MQLVGEWFRRLWYLINRRRRDAALREEMAAHRSLMGDDGRRFGNTLRLREDARDVWGWAWLDGLARDLRLATRALGRTPGFTIATISSLALGFALTASTVAVVNAYLIRPLPFAAADRLYHVMYAPPGPWEPGGMSGLDWKSVGDVVEFPITASGDTFYLMNGGFTQSARGLRVTRDFVEGLGVRAVIGRSLSEPDFRGNADRVALVGHALWRERYGSDPGIVGRYVRGDAESRGGATETFRIVGVLPPDFYFGRDSRDTVDLLVPLTAHVRTYMVRLREGVPPGHAERRITQAARDVASGLPSDWSGVHLESAHQRYVGELRSILVGVTAAVGLVVVIVCANVAVLTLLRTMRRQKEMAVRVTLGAGRRHLARMLAAESSLLCAAALAIGMMLTRFALRLAAPLIETELGRPAPGGTSGIAIDGTVLLVVGALGTLIALSLSFLPLLMPWRRLVTNALGREGTTATDGRSIRHLRSALIAFEVAGTLVLLVGCGLMVGSVLRMTRTDLGFQPDRMVTARIVLRGSDYPESPAFFRFYDQFTEKLSAISKSPVVFASWPPFADLPRHSVQIDPRDDQGVPAGAMAVGAGYFTAFGIDLRSGRDFTSADVSQSAPVAVISETLARRLWGNENAIGRQLRGVEHVAAVVRPGGPWRTVVGVAADVRQRYADAELGDVYVPVSPSSFGRYGSFYMRTDRVPSSLLETMRAVATGLDPHAVVGLLRSVEAGNRELAGTRFLTSMLTGFAGTAAFLALLGIYGVTAYGVHQREREIAIRMALGAESHTVVRLFVKDGGRVLAAGLVAGLVGATLMARLLESRLYGVRAFDLPTLIAGASLLAAAGVLATWWPARRASLRSPVVALKEG